MSDIPLITVPMCGSDIPDGMWPAMIVGVCDIGMVDKWQGEMKHMVTITFLTEHGELTERYTLNLGPLANLRKVVDACEGFTRLEASKGLGRLAGKSVAITVVSKEGSKGGMYSVVQSVSRLRSGTPPKADTLTIWSRSSGTPPPACLPRRILKLMPEWAHLAERSVMPDKDAGDDSPFAEESEDHSPPITENVIQELWKNSKALAHD